MPPRSPDWQKSRATDAPIAYALSQAIDLAQAPRLVAHMRRRPLPRDVLKVIRIASGCTETIAEATVSTSRDHTFVVAAAELYLRQVVCFPGADPYRTLGVAAHASHAQMRLQMRELALWLHPDRQRAGGDAAMMQRILQAWRIVDGSRASEPDPRHLGPGVGGSAGRTVRGGGYRPTWIAQPLPKKRRGRVTSPSTMAMRVAILAAALVVPESAFLDAPSLADGPYRPAKPSNASFSAPGADAPPLLRTDPQ